MAHKLADELLKEILSPPLVVDDALFSDTGAVSPFSKATYSASDVLLVCKRWMRVGTPALYHTVVVRSLAQAQALGAALKRNPEFGRYVRKLRIEGAYGTHLAQVALVCLDITDFCFTLSIWADSNAAGLVKLLSAINPARVIMTTAPRKVIRNKQLSQVLERLCSCIPNWTKLHTFHYSGSHVALRRWRTTSESEHYQEIARALSASASLRDVHLNGDPFITGYESLSILAVNVNIKNIYIHTRDISALTPRDISSISTTHNLTGRLKSIHNGTHTMKELRALPITTEEAALENPFYVPMERVSKQVSYDIWHLILQFALENKEKSSPRLLIRGYWFDADRYDVATAPSLFLVSREFHRIAISILCKHLVMHDEKNLATVQRYMDLYSISPSSVRSFRSSAYRDLNVAPFLSTMTGLRMCSVSADSVSIHLLGQASGGTLEDLVLRPNYHTHQRPWTMSLFVPFTALKRLTVAAPTTVGSASILSEAERHSSLARLKEISLAEYDATTLEAFASLSLPVLERLSLNRDYGSIVGAFYQSHGKKLKYLSTSNHMLYDKLRLCQNLETLVLNRESDSLSLDDFRDGHPTVREIKIHAYVLSMPARNALDNTGSTVGAFKREVFPALQSVQLMCETDIWPTSERDIKRSQWPGYADALRKEGITLLDYTGRAWRSRLTARGAR